MGQCINRGNRLAREPTGNLLAGPLGPMVGAGLGDMRVGAKVEILDEEWAGISGAIIPELTIPLCAVTGYLRNAGVGFAPVLAISRHLGPVHLALNAGYRLRPRGEIAEIIVDDELFAFFSRLLTRTTFSKAATPRRH